MRLRTTIFAAVLILPSTAMADFIGPIPGIGALIRRADAVVILRVRDHIEPRILRNGWSIHQCFILQTLKGDIPAGGKIIPLRLLNTRGSFDSPYALGSTHLMFLRKTKNSTPKWPSEYHTIQFEGANIRLSPFGHEKMPEGKTVEEKVKALIKDALEYRQKQYEKERKFLESVIGK